MPAEETNGTNGEVKGKISLKRAESLVLIMDTPKGRGVFAAKDIPSQTVLEVSPVLVLDPVENEQHVKKTDLYNYTYNWPYQPPKEARATMNGTSSTPATTQAIIFGIGSMFNHSTLHQNVGWKRDIENLLITYTSLRDIKAGEELCISYGSRLTFEDKDETKLQDSDNEDWTTQLDIINLVD